MQQILVVKIGTNALVDSAGLVDRSVLRNITKGILTLRKREKQVVLVSSGAVGVAKGLLPHTCFPPNTTKIERRQIQSAVGQPLLMDVYRDMFAPENVIVSQGLVTRSDFMSKERHQSMKKILGTMLDAGVLPIINENDFLTPEELDFSDNDQLASFVAGMLAAEKLILLSNVDGFYNGDPRDPASQKINVIPEITPEIENLIQEDKSADGLGGMASKIHAAKILSQLGIPLVLASSRNAGVLEAIDAGEKIGTTFLPRGRKRHSGTKVFLASGAVYQGELFLDCPLEKFLQKKKSGISILGVGVEKVKGDFKQGEPVALYSPDKKLVGKGIAHIDAEKMRENIGKKGVIFVHADRLFLL